MITLCQNLGIMDSHGGDNKVMEVFLWDDHPQKSLDDGCQFDASKPSHPNPPLRGWSKFSPEWHGDIDMIKIIGALPHGIWMEYEWNNTMEY